MRLTGNRYKNNWKQLKERRKINQKVEYAHTDYLMGATVKSIIKVVENV